MTPEAIAAAAARVPSAEAQRQSIPDMADGLYAQLLELWARPCPSAAETLAANLRGASVIVLRFRESMLSEGSGNET